jgi:5'-nucleotidase
MTTYDRPPVVLVDMDGVQAYLETEFWDRWALAHPDLPQRSDIAHTTFVLGNRFGGKYVDEINEVLDADGFFADLAPLAGAVEAMNAMLDLGWDVRVVTAPLLTNRTCASDKFEWQALVNGAQWPARTIITRDKTLVRGDILIDDKPTIVGMLTPTWRHVVFDQPYNQHAESPYRLAGWENWQQTLTPLLGRTAAA